MRRRARVLSAAVLAGAVLGVTAPVASADPAAEVVPNEAAPGETVTISVSCDPTDGPAPENIDASSQAFEQGTVTLQRIPGDDDPAGGPSYQGTARIAQAADFETGPDAAGGSTEWGGDGVCPAPPGAEQKQWSAAFAVDLGGHHPTDQPTHEPTYQPTHEPTYPPTHEPTHQPTHHDTQRPAPVQRGVHAGSGGAFTDSVPAMVAGGLLIAGALGAAVHRLLHRRGRWAP
ncbi:PT domain-containing protein [Streptomyces sp. MA5143a]|uniref:PT domain-containing protein n=1 Tax=Streptomyces sp. MA5143a TaxID=2083010 RepID=UPI000D1BC1CB|nr:PT domain-containing protein [Streptomyces sp. MA5143a]SPF00140.1 putative hemoglobin and hemoglobin-haptoglobin-binding protein 3 precursor [Streptomyces sp. MA5143a]